MNSDMDRLKAIVQSSQRDYYIFSGEIRGKVCEDFVKNLKEKGQSGNEATLFLTTYGGFPAWAYRMATSLQACHKSYRVCIFGPCKSAGTLIVLGAREIAFGPLGELGPLDVQIGKPDEILGAGSGLDTVGAFECIRKKAFDSFEQNMLDFLRDMNGTVSTRMSCDISAQLVIGLLQGITSQIDPYRLAEVERALGIATAYGRRLLKRSERLTDGTEDALERLVTEYPDHGFVIDRKEAEELFGKEMIVEATDEENEVAGLFLRALEAPIGAGLAIDLSGLREGNDIKKKEVSNEGIAEPQPGSGSVEHSPSSEGGGLDDIDTTDVIAEWHSN